MDTPEESKIILKEHNDFYVRITKDAVNHDIYNMVSEVSWDVQHFMNSPWALDPQSRWEVALTELSLPKTFQMLPERIHPLKFAVSTPSELYSQVYLLPENGFYNSASQVVECMNASMEVSEPIDFGADEEVDISETDSLEEESASSDSLMKMSDCVEFIYDPHTLRVLMRIKNQPPEDIRISFSEGMQELLNLYRNDFIISSRDHDGQIERVVFSEIFNFSLLTDYIHILLQEANMSFINNKMVPWLYSCSIGSSNVVSHSHTHINIKPVSLCYVPLNLVNSMRDKLNISVVDDSLKILKPQKQIYSNNTTVFHLHFRNIIPGR